MAACKPWCTSRQNTTIPLPCDCQNEPQDITQKTLDKVDLQQTEDIVESENLEREFPLPE
jgi:hypothetical protein